MIEPVAHGFHDEEPHNQRKQPLQPMRQHVNDNLFPRQDAEEILDGASFGRVTSGHNRDQGAGDIAREIAEGRIENKALEFVTVKSRSQETVHGVSPCDSRVVGDQRIRREVPALTP